MIQVVAPTPERHCMFVLYSASTVDIKSQHTAVKIAGFGDIKTKIIHTVTGFYKCMHFFQSSLQKCSRSIKLQGVLLRTALFKSYHSVLGRFISDF